MKGTRSGGGARRRSAAIVRDLMEVRAGGRTFIINHVFRFLSVGVRDVRLTDVSVLFARAVFPPADGDPGERRRRRWQYYENFTVNSYTRKSLREIARDPMPWIWRVKNTEKDTFRRSGVFIYLRVPEETRFYVGPETSPPTSLPRRTFFLFASAVPDGGHKRTREGMYTARNRKLWRRKNSKKKRASFSARRVPLLPQPPSPYPYAAVRSAVFRPQPNGRFSRFRHVDRHTAALPHTAGALPSNRIEIVVRLTRAPWLSWKTIVIVLFDVHIWTWLRF